MATQYAARFGSHTFFGALISAHPDAMSRCVLVLFCLLLFPIPAHAQFQSAFVFAPDPAGVAVYTRNDATGVLTPVAGSPFHSRVSVNVMALDFAGRFLFTASNSGATRGEISMFTIDPNTGAVQEVPNSPFASPATK